MKTNRIVSDIADRPGAGFGRPVSVASTSVFRKSHTSPVSPERSRRRMTGMPLVPSSRNMAELKIHVDGLPFLFLFPIEDFSPPKQPRGAFAGHTDIHSVLSNTLELIVDRMRGAGTRVVASSSSRPELNVVEMSPETDAIVARPEAQTMLRVGLLELNLIDRTAKRGERQIDLRPREFRLLRYMMERSDKLLTRAQLLQDVWNYKFVPQTNLVDVHMGRLRRKVDGPNELAMIRSVRGVGFVLNADPLSQN
jgi:DNA-binding winged helix-turn-helix (wHTH) protein